MGIVQAFDTAAAKPLDRARAEKLLALELLRFVSAMAVLFFHYRHFAHLQGVQPVLRQDVPLYALLWPLYDYGQFGVQVFWAISGYIFFWKYGAAIHGGAVRAGRFAWLRFSRLYPLHIATLLAVAALQPLHRALAGADFIYPSADPGLFVRQLFMATDWGPPSPFSFNGPIWSVSAEVAVYAIFFLALRRFPPSLALCVAGVAAGLALQSLGVDWISVACATYFFAGGIATVVKPRRDLALGAVAAIAALGWFLDVDRAGLPMLLLAILPPLIVLLSGDWPLLDRWQGPVEAAGNLTYSTYLLHFPLQLLLAIFVASSGWAPNLADPLFLAAYLGITIAAGLASYRWFEVPAQAWLRNR